jgi:hypothetical protein
MAIVARAVVGKNRAASVRTFLGETFLLGDSTIGAGASIDLGELFNKQPGNPSLSEDWQFTFRTASGLIKTGVVSYVSAVAAASSVPEPTTLLLTAMASIGLMLRRTPLHSPQN